MRKNDFGTKKGPRAKSVARGRSGQSGSAGRNPGRGADAGAGERRGARGRFEERSEGIEFSEKRPRKDGAGGQSGQRQSTDWSTGGYRINKKGSGRSSEFKGYNKDAVQGERGPRRDSNQGFRGPKSEDFKGFRGKRKEEGQGYRGPRRDDNQNYRGPRRDDNQEYRGPRRDDSQEYRGPRRDDGQGFKGPKKDTRTNSGYRDQRKGYVKKTPRLPINKKDEFRSKKEEIEVTRNYNEVEVKDNIEREDRIEGRNSVFEAMRSGRPINKLFVEKDSEDVLISRIVAMAREKDIPIQYLERNKLDFISQTRTHQGVILEVAAKEYVEVEDILKIAEDKEEKPFVLVLDGITDTNNLGSIIRSAECAGVHGIILPKRRSATLNATVAKVAAGALEYVSVARVTNLVQTLRTLKNEGLWIIGADMDGETNFQDADLTGPTALVIGSEGEGLARLVKDECDLMVKIPMKGKISSLNAGVAAALVMFEISKQRD